MLIGFREIGRGRSGIETNRIWFQVYTFRDGKLALLREFSDRADALEAAGLTGPWRRLRSRMRDRARQRATHAESESGS